MPTTLEHRYIYVDKDPNISRPIETVANEESMYILYVPEQVTCRMLWMSSGQLDIACIRGKKNIKIMRLQRFEVRRNSKKKQHLGCPGGKQINIIFIFGWTIPLTSVIHVCNTLHLKNPFSTLQCNRLNVLGGCCSILPKCISKNSPFPSLYDNYFLFSFVLASTRLKF